MRKASLFSGVLFLLVPLLVWKSGSGLEPVTSVCTEDWLVARMKRKPFANDTEVRFGDIYLGNNCSATRVLLFNYEFSYPVTNCGIKKIVFPGNDMIILSEINYRPTLDTTYEFEVLCLIKRLLLPPMVPFGMSGFDASTLSGSCPNRAEGQQSSAGHQIKYEHHSSNYCINNACFITSSLPLDERADGTHWSGNQFQ